MTIIRHIWGLHQRHRH